MSETNSYDEIYQYLPHSKDHNHADHEEGEKQEKGAQREYESLKKYQSRTSQMKILTSKPSKTVIPLFLIFHVCWIIFVPDDYVDFSIALRIFHWWMFQKMLMPKCRRLNFLEPWKVVSARFLFNAPSEIGRLFFSAASPWTQPSSNICTCLFEDLSDDHV